MDTEKQGVVLQQPNSNNKLKRKDRRDCYQKIRKRKTRRRPGRVQRLKRTITTKESKIENLKVETVALKRSVRKSIAEKKMFERLWHNYS